jgi:ArsR family transcriptional regulator, arsenate/arsenite/antimonite-responsive transcriptional repressor
MEAPQFVKALSALAQDARLQAFRVLVQAGPEGCTAGALAERLAVPPTTLSFHLAQLLQAGLVSQRRQGRQLIYAATYETMNGLIAYLTENCCGRGASYSACKPAASPSIQERKHGNG